MAAKLILFDVDGTLVDTAGAGRQAMERAFHEVFSLDGVEHLDSVPYAGRTDPTILEAMADLAGVPPARFRAARREVIERFVAALHDVLARPDPRRRVLPGVRPLLEHIRALEGVHQGLLTGNLEAGARAKLAVFDLNRFFATGGFASDDPDRRQIARIARRKVAAATGVTFEAADVTVVGDTEHDVDCARANGFRAVAVDSGWVPRERLVRARPDVLLDDLADRSRVLEALEIGAG